jgi:hypothetical protein
MPFQTIEHVDEPRAEKPEDAAAQLGLFDERGRQLKGWTNKQADLGRQQADTFEPEETARCAMRSRSRAGSS